MIEINRDYYDLEYSTQVTPGKLAPILADDAPCLITINQTSAIVSRGVGPGDHRFNPNGTLDTNWLTDTSVWVRSMNYSWQIQSVTEPIIAIPEYNNYALQLSDPLLT